MKETREQLLVRMLGLAIFNNRPVTWQAAVRLACQYGKHMDPPVQQAEIHAIAERTIREVFTP